MRTIQLREDSVYQSPVRLLVILVITIFSAEILIMFFLHSLALPLWIEGLLDGLVLTLLIFPALYFSVFRPLSLCISGCKLAEHDVKELSDRIQHILENTPAVHYSCRIDGEQLVPAYASPNLKDILGYGPEEYLGNPDWWWSGIYPEVRDEIAGAFRTVLFDSDRSRYSHEYRFRYKDGTYHWIHDELQIVRDNEGRPQEIVGSWLDVTDRKKAEEEQGRLLKEAERINRELQEKSKYLERLNRQMVGRETRVLEMKKEVNDLLERLGEAKRYEWTAEHKIEKA